MKRFSEQLQKKANMIRLSTAERDVLRDRLSAYMEYHPLPEAVTATARKRIFNDSFIEVAFPMRYMRGFVALGVVMLLVAVPSLAERAVPGDILYPIKVQVNEEVRSQLANDGYEKIAWETKRLERRISEARLLAKEGKLTSEIEADVIAAVQSHQEATEQEIDTLRANDVDAAALASLTLASVLDVQSAALKANGVGSTTEGRSTIALSTVLDEAQAVIVNGNDTTVSYQHLAAQLEAETTRGRELLASIKDDATPQERLDIERRLADVERKVASGITLARTDTVAATESLRTTWRDVQALVTFMTDIDVRASLALETLVPVVPTPEEDREIAAAAYTDAARELAFLMEQTETLPEGGLKEKIDLTIPEIESLLVTASTTMTSDATAAKTAAVAAAAYTEALLQAGAFVFTPTEGWTLPVAVATTTPTTTEATASTTASDGEDESGSE
jgi:hypothetical protein